MTVVAGQVLEYERSLWRCGLGRLAGIDEAGRGALAGPLVAAAVCCSGPDEIERLLTNDLAALVRDSKTLSPGQRTLARELVCSSFECHGVGIVTAEEIDAFGIAAANRMAMERTLIQIDRSPEFLLIDAFTIDSGIPQWGIIDGDAQSLLIAAASIVAKVTRDLIMEEMARTYCGFSFDRHRGYATSAHFRELEALGPCSIHRRSFEPVRSMVNSGP